MGNFFAAIFGKRVVLHHPPKSPYHELADLYKNSVKHEHAIVEKCLSLGLRERASKLINDTRVELSLRQRIELALLYGDSQKIHSWDDEIYDYCTNACRDPRLVASITQRIVAVAPTLVARIGRSTGLKMVPCYPAAEILIDRVRAKEQFSRNTLFSLGGDGRLLAAMLSDAVHEKFYFLKKYFDWHKFPHRLSNQDIFSWGDAFSPNAVRKITKMGEITVVVTTFNCEEFIVASLSSLLSQSVVPAEIIVVDDCSTDNTVSVVQQLAEAFPCIRVVPLEINVGTYRAKNIGMELARGRYITFQDADDLSHPFRLEFCLRELKRNRCLVAVTCNYLRVDRQANFYSPKVWPLTQWSPNTVFFCRQRVAERGLIMDDTRFGGDSEYVARLKTVFGVKAHKKIYKPLLLALHRPDSLMTSAMTGLDSYGVSVARMEYQNAWAERLFQLALQDGG